MATQSYFAAPGVVADCRKKFKGASDQSSVNPSEPAVRLLLGSNQQALAADAQSGYLNGLYLGEREESEGDE